MEELQEEWKEINGYKISNYGKVIGKNGKLLSANISNHGYINCSINMGEPYGKVEGMHRIIAIAFIPNPDNKSDVNHKDANKTNNRVDNLEWATRKENMQHSSINRLNPSTMWVCLVSDDEQVTEVFRSLNNFIEVYKTGSEHKIKVDDAYACIIGKQNDFYGVKVRKYDFDNKTYIKTKFDDPNYKFTSTRKMKLKCIETGEIFKSQMDASRKLGVSQVLISENLRKNNGRVDKYTFVKI